VLLYGRGNNGKSTLLKETSTIIGLSMSAVDVARTVRSSKHSTPPDVISDLAGCRIANCGDVDLNSTNLN
jgi:phage/plasmid-associated DNA primase